MAGQPPSFKERLPLFCSFFGLTFEAASLRFYRSVQKPVDVLWITYLSNSAFDCSFPGIHRFLAGFLVVPVLGHGFRSGEEANAVDAQNVLVAEERLLVA